MRGFSPPAIHVHASDIDRSQRDPCCAGPCLAHPLTAVPSRLLHLDMSRQRRSLPDWAKIADAHQERLSRVDSDQGAREVFVGAVGRAAALPDVAGTLAVQGMSTKLAKDLMVPQITTSAQRLVSALVAWRLADRIMQVSGRQGGPGGDRCGALPGRMADGQRPVPFLERRHQVVGCRRHERSRRRRCRPFGPGGRSAGDGGMVASQDLERPRARHAWPIASLRDLAMGDPQPSAAS